MWVHPKKKNYARKWKEGGTQGVSAYSYFLMRVFLYGVRRGLLRFLLSLCVLGCDFLRLFFLFYILAFISRE